MVGASVGTTVGDDVMSGVYTFTATVPAHTPVVHDCVNMYVSQDAVDTPV